VNSNKKYMNKPKKEIRKIAVFGASSVYGVGDEEYGGFVGRLKSWRESIDKRNFVYNLGIPGNTTFDILDRLDTELSARKADLVIFSFGNNDCSREGIPEENPPITFLDQYKENVENILRKTQNYTKNILVLGIYPFDESKTMPYNLSDWYFLLYDAISYDYAVEEVCNSVGVKYCNLMSDWLKRGFKDLLSSDGLHANVKGYELIFEKLKENILENFGIEK
jgi:lysophospholipase L1-like esterase